MSNAKAGAPEELIKAYEEALQAERNHVVIGRSMIAQAMKLMKDDPSAIAKAGTLYDTGTKIESRANANIIELIKDRPR